MAAKRKRRTAVARTTTKIIKAPAPIIRVAAPRAAPVKRRSHRRRSSHSGGGSALGGLISTETIQMALGGAIYGFCVKQGLVDKLPAIPIVGRTGTAALVLDYWSRRGGGRIVHTAARAAAAIAGYQLGSTGKIQGDLATTGDFAMGMADNASTPGSMAGDDDGY